MDAVVHRGCSGVSFLIGVDGRGMLQGSANIRSSCRKIFSNSTSVSTQPVIA